MCPHGGGNEGLLIYQALDYGEIWGLLIIVLKVQREMGLLKNRVSDHMLFFAENKSSSFQEFDFGVLNRATSCFVCLPVMRLN